METGLLFPGYGSQFVGMGKELYDRERLVQEYFEEAATCLSINFVKLCFASSEVELAKITNAYPALFLMGACSSGLLRERGLVPNVVAGTDIVSWYTALFAAGSLSLPDGLYILSKIAQAYEEFLASGVYAGLLAHGITKRKLMVIVDKLADGRPVSLAGSTPDGLMLVGDKEAIETIYQELRETPACTVSMVDIQGGFHTPLVESFALPLNDYLEKIDIKTPELPIVSPLTGKLVTKSDQLRTIARTLLMKPRSVDAVLKTVSNVERLCIAIPSGRSVQRISELMPEVTIITMETVAAFDALFPVIDKDPEHVAEPHEPES